MLVPTFHLALFQPDIPQNAGTLLRLCACLNIHAHIIEPMGFGMNSKDMRRAGLDYMDQVSLRRHLSWEHFETWRENENQKEKKHRLLLLTTHSCRSYTDFSYLPGDILLLGRESKGVPQYVHDKAEARLLIPMNPSMRSLNVALAGAIVAGEMCRQLGLIRSKPPINLEY